MTRKRTILILAAATIALTPARSFAQEPIAPLDQIPTGFMIEGLLSANMFTSTDGVSIINAASVPAIVLGYRMPKVAIGLGFNLYRGSIIVKDETSDSKFSDAYTSALFAPRLEFSLVRKAVAEAYLVASFGAGFADVRQKAQGGGIERTEADYGPVLGAHVGLGGRCFFAGGPFALGMEMGWSGLFINIKDEENEESTWIHIMGFYGALVGTFVFG